jgi:hypothetical protein
MENCGAYRDYKSRTDDHPYNPQLEVLGLLGGDLEPAECIQDSRHQGEESR